MSMPPEYAELHCLSNFTFLRGASHPEELVRRAQALGYSALALTDECSLAGVVRAHLAARALGLKLIVGSEFRIDRDGVCSSTPSPLTLSREGRGGVGSLTRLVLLATDRKTYGDLSELITHARRAAEKGSYRATRADVARFAPNCLALWLPGAAPDPAAAAWIKETFPGRAWIAVELLLDGADGARLDELTALSRATGLPLVAAG